MLLYFAPHHVFGLYNGFACCTPTPLVPVFPFPARAFHMRPYSSDNAWYRNLNLLSIAYVLRPVLRPRLTQSRSALLWKPWIFGHKDSHLILATHSGILSSISSTCPLDHASPYNRMLPYQLVQSLGFTSSFFPWSNFASALQLHFLLFNMTPNDYTNSQASV